MIELRTLGTIDLSGAGPASGVLLQQPKRLALLAYLSLARPWGLHRRDTLVALFWPDLDNAHARGALSQALHVLRRAIGHDVVVTRGAELVGLDPERLRCDAAVFDVAVRAGRLPEALELYGGQLLPGLAVSDAPAFERWLEDERARLARLYEESLERLARQAEDHGDPRAAVDLWRRLLNQDLYHTRAVLGLMRALDASGERAEALRSAQTHIRRVREELEVEPDPAITRLVDAFRCERTHLPAQDRPATDRTPATELRTPQAPVAEGAHPGPGTASQPAARRRKLAVIAALALLGLVATGALSRAAHRRLPASGEAAATVRLAVVPFVPAGTSANDTVLADGLAEDVLTTLAQAPGLSVTARGSAFRLRGQRNVHEVGEQLGVAAVLAGRIERCGEQVCVTAELVDTRSGRTRWAERYERPPEDIVRLREDISLDVAVELRVRLAPYRPRRHTESVWASDQFLRGVFAHRTMTPENLWKALQFYRAAYEEDPNFALAHAVSATAYIQLGGHDIASDILFANAREHAERALELDTLLAEGHVALATIQLWHDWDFAAAERSLRRALMLYPSHPQAHSQYAWYLLQVRGKPEEAIASTRRALELDPLNTGRSYSVEMILYLARRYDDVLDQHRTTVGLAPAFPPIRDESAVAGAYREMGMYAEALAEYQRLVEQTGGVPPAGLAVTYARMGRTADAVRILHELEERAHNGGTVAPGHIARIFAVLGDTDRAFEWLEQAYQRRSPELLQIGVEPGYDTLRGDPRFADLLRRLGISAPVPSTGIPGASQTLRAVAVP